MKTENRPEQTKGFSQYLAQEAGFTFIELIMVIIMIGILTSIAAGKMISAVQQAEITAEDRTIDVMRSNLINNFGNDLLNGLAAQFPDDPFTNLSKVPEGYDRQNNSAPSGAEDDASTWAFVSGGGGNLTPEEAGTTIADFQTTGEIFHQRKDLSVASWPYDSSNGIIGKKQLKSSSRLKEEEDRAKRRRGEPTEQDRLDKTQ